MFLLCLIETSALYARKSFSILGRRLDLEAWWAKTISSKIDERGQRLFDRKAVNTRSEHFETLGKLSRQLKSFRKDTRTGVSSKPVTNLWPWTHRNIFSLLNYTNEASRVSVSPWSGIISARETRLINQGFKKLKRFRGYIVWIWAFVE